MNLKILLFKPNSEKKIVLKIRKWNFLHVCVCVQHEKWLILITSACPHVINTRLTLSLHPIHIVLLFIYPISGFCKLGNRKVQSWRWSHRLVTWKREYVAMCTYCCKYHLTHECWTTLLYTRPVSRLTTGTAVKLWLWEHRNGSKGTI
jgi:hypothetical protein